MNKILFNLLIFFSTVHLYSTPYLLPENFAIYTDGTTVLNWQPSKDFEKRHLPTYNFYEGENGGYIALYTRDASAGIYTVGEGIYVLGQIRVKGHYEGRIFITEGYKTDELLDICIQYFPHMAGSMWIGGNTGGWFGIQPSACDRSTTVNINSYFINSYFLPEDFIVYTDGTMVLNWQPSENFEKRHLPTFNFYEGKDGGYVAIYTRNTDAGVYGVGGGIYVMGQIRVQGHYHGRIFIPQGYKPGDNITQDSKILDLCNHYFPHMAGSMWLGGDTGGWFGIQ